MTEIWRNAKNQLKKQLAPHTFRMWIESIGSEEDEESVILFFPNQFSLDRVEREVGEIIRKTVGFFVGGSSLKKKIVFSVKKPEKASQLGLDLEKIIPMAKPKQKMLPNFSGHNIFIPRRLNPEYTFENLVIGDFNQYAALGAQMYPFQTEILQPMFILGDHGLGKSHLASAAAHLFQSRFPEKELLYLSGADFVQSVQAAYRYDALEMFWKKFHLECDLLILDQLEQVAGRKKSEEIFSDILDRFRESGKMVIMTSFMRPDEFKASCVSFLSRIRCSAFFPLSPPDFSGRLKILEKEGERRGMNFMREASAYLAGEISGDIRPLVGVVATLSERAKGNGNKISREMAERAVEFYRQKKNITPEGIAGAVSLVLGIDRKGIFLREKAEPIATARQIVMYLCRKILGTPFDSIGQFCGGREHATVLYAMKKAPGKMATLGPGKKEALRKSLISLGVREDEVAQIF